MSNFEEKWMGLKSAMVCVQYKTDLVIAFANDAFYALLGFDEKELEKKNGLRLSALLPVQQFIKIQTFLTNEKDTLEMELSFKNNTNSYTYVIAMIQKMQGEEQDMICIQCCVIDKYKSIQRHYEDLSIMFDRLLDYRKVGVVLFDRRGGCIRYCNMTSLIIGGPCVNDIFPDVLLESGIVHPDYIQRVDACRKFLDRDRVGNQLLLEIKVRNAKHEYIWIHMDMSIQEFRGHEVVMCIFYDVDNQKKTSEQFMEQSMFYQSVLSSKDAYGHIDVTEDRFMNMGGLWNVYNEVKDTMSYSQLFHSFIDKIVHPQDRKHYTEVMEVKNLLDSFENGITNIGCEFRRIVDQNKMTWMEITIHLFKNATNQHVMALMYIKNIDDKKRVLKAVSIEEEYDYLTNLYAHNTLLHKVSEYLKSMRPDENCAFIYCNINHMKGINTTYGYEAGDSILVALSTILSAVFRRRDIIGRYHNDHFVIVLKDVFTGNFENRMETLFNMVDMCSSIPFHVSLGVVYATKDDTFANCFKQAYTALMHLNNKDENAYRVYQDDSITKEESEVFQHEVQRVLKNTQKYEENIHHMNDIDFDQMLGVQGDMAYVVNPDTYELLLGNQALYDRLGITKVDSKGRMCYDLLHGRSTPCAFCQKSNWSSDKFHIYRNYNKNLEQEFLIKNRLTQWKGSTVLLAFAIDLSNDKRVVDSMQKDMSEETYIIEGIQNMQKSNVLDEVMSAALQTIGLFFRADVVRFWDIEHKGHEPKWTYYEQTEAQDIWQYDTFEIQEISEWLRSRQWKNYMMIENPEVMLSQSYSLSIMMKQKHIQNQRWFSLYDGRRELGMIEIDNAMSNLQNVSFLQNFTSFVGKEWHKCKMLDDILYNLVYDNLTGLYNRKKYDEFLMKYDPDMMESVASIVIDINGLSKINSLKGSKEGDRYLKTVAKCMSESFQGAICFRLGGDEFQALWMDVELSELERSIQVYQDKIAQLNEFSISIGYAWDSVEKKLTSLIEYASKSMLVNKTNKKNRIHELDNIDQFKMQNELITSLEKGEYVIYLQPKVNAKYGTVVGAEALIRRVGKNGSIIPPSEYITKFEKLGLIRYIDLFVFEEVCKLTKRWLDKRKKCPIISLNFSRLTMMEENLIEIMDTIVEKYGIPKKYLEIEITESYGNVGKTMLYQSARKIHEACYSVSLDDFGTDFTNLSILSDIHVDVLKIDKSLIQSMSIQEKNMTVLKHIIDMCKELHITVIAEGVENMEQRNSLMKLGCELIQGYLFSRPIDITSFEQAFLPRVSK